MSFLVTGASGFVGRRLVITLLGRFPKAKVVAQYRHASRAISDRRVIPLVAGLAGMPEALNRSPDLPERFDGVFHLAARIPKSTRDDPPEETARANILGTIHLLEAVSGRSNHIVFSSTVDVYAPLARGETLRETSPLGPGTHYAASKLFGEILFRNWAPTGNERAAVVRLGHIYGPGEGAYRKLIPETIRRLLAGEPALLFGDGMECRDFLYVEDAANGLIAAWETLKRGPVGPVNLASGFAITVREAIEIICEEAGRPGFIEQHAGHAVPRSLQFDLSMAKKALNFNATTHFRDGIRKEIEWFQRTQ